MKQFCALTSRPLLTYVQSFITIFRNSVTRCSLEIVAACEKQAVSKRWKITKMIEISTHCGFCFQHGIARVLIQFVISTTTTLESRTSISIKSPLFYPVYHKAKLHNFSTGIRGIGYSLPRKRSVSPSRNPSRQSNHNSIIHGRNVLIL